MSNINVDLFFFINHNLQNPLFDSVIPFVTELGSFLAMFTICVIAIILSIVFKKQTIKRIALMCLLSLLIADGIALVLKTIICEPRPFITFDNVHLLVVENDPFSFPSGHTTSTFAVIGFLVFKLKNKLLDLILILFGIIIGFSRIYVGVHYPLDVITGMILGVLSAYLIYRYEDEIFDFLVRLRIRV